MYNKESCRQYTNQGHKGKDDNCFHTSFECHIVYTYKIINSYKVISFRKGLNMLKVPKT